MKCKQVMDYLPSYMGKEIPWWKQLIIQRHLRSCKSCQLELIKLKKARDLSIQFLNEKQTNITDDALWERILPRLPEKESIKTQIIQKPKQRRSPVRKWIPAIVGIPIIIIIVLMSNLQQKLPKEEQQNIGVKNYPVVENVKPGVTVMTFQTDDPKVTIVWFFEEESDDERKEGLL